MGEFTLYNNGCRTQHALDGWELRVFEEFAWLRVGSGKMAFSRPTHQRHAPRTQTVSRQYQDDLEFKIEGGHFK